MSEYNKALQHDIDICEEAINDLKSVKSLIDDKGTDGHLHLFSGDREITLGENGLIALQSAIVSKIIAYKNAIRNNKKRMI